MAEGLPPSGCRLCVHWARMPVEVDASAEDAGRWTPQIRIAGLDRLRQRRKSGGSSPDWPLRNKESWLLAHSRRAACLKLLRQRIRSFQSGKTYWEKLSCASPCVWSNGQRDSLFFGGRSSARFTALRKTVRVGVLKGLGLMAHNSWSGLLDQRG